MLSSGGSQLGIPQAVQAQQPLADTMWHITEQSVGESESGGTLMSEWGGGSVQGARESGTGGCTSQGVASLRRCSRPQHGGSGGMGHAAATDLPCNTARIVPATQHVPCNIVCPVCNTVCIVPHSTHSIDAVLPIEAVLCCALLTLDKSAAERLARGLNTIHGIKRLCEQMHTTMWAQWYVRGLGAVKLCKMRWLLAAPPYPQRATFT